MIIDIAKWCTGTGEGDAARASKKGACTSRCETAAQHDKYCFPALVNIGSANDGSVPRGQHGSTLNNMRHEQSVASETIIAHGKCKLILHRNSIGLSMLSNATCSLDNVQTLTNLNLHPESGQVRTHLPVMIGREQWVS